MANLTTSADVDAFLSAADNTAARTALGAMPGLPVWTYAGVGSNPAAGEFKVDNATPSANATFYLGAVPKNGGVDLGVVFALISYESVLMFTSSSGKTLVYEAPGGAQHTGNVIVLNVTSVATDAVTFAGDYQVNILAPYELVRTINGVGGVVVVVPPDTGWTANADAGDKTAAVPAMPDTSALEAISPNFTAWGAAIDKKVKALETALANNLRPNA